MNLRHSLIVAGTVVFTLSASAGIASLLSSADPTGSKSLPIIKQESSRWAIIRGRAPVEHQLSEEERDAIQIERIERAIDEAQPGVFHPAAPTEKSVDELIKNCFDAGYSNSRLIKCLGAAEEGKEIDRTRW